MATQNEPLPAKEVKKRRILLWVGIIIFFGFSYGSGMSAELHVAKKINEQRKLSAQDYRDAQRKLRLRIAAVEQLEARRQIALALNDLDQRNYGTAQDAVNAAVKLMTQAQAADSTNPDLSREIDALKKTNLAVATNMGPQRDALAAVAAQIDTAFNGYYGQFINLSVADDTAHPIKPPTMNDVPMLPGENTKPDAVSGQDHREGGQ